MSAAREHVVTTMARRIGLQLVQPLEGEGVSLYRLVEPASRQAVFPGGGTPGVALEELEDWLAFPWA
jgi:hypothetical protein